MLLFKLLVRLDPRIQGARRFHRVRRIVWVD